MTEDRKGKTEGRVISGVGGSGTEWALLLLLAQLLLLQYEGSEPSQSQRKDGLPFPAGHIGGGRVVLARTNVEAKRKMSRRRQKHDGSFHRDVQTRCIESGLGGGGRCEPWLAGEPGTDGTLGLDLGMIR